MGYEEAPCPSHLRAPAGRGTLTHQAAVAIDRVLPRPAQEQTAAAAGVATSWVLLSVTTGEVGPGGRSIMDHQ